MDDKGEVIRANILLASGSKVEIQEAPTQNRAARALIFIPSFAIPRSDDVCIRKNLHLPHDPYFSA